MSDPSEAPGAIDLPLPGRQVTRCCLDAAFGIEFLEGRESISLRIESPFQVCRLDERWSLRPDDLTTIVHALRLLWRIVVRATASADGTLNVRFDDGTELIVAYDSNYEAWELVGSGGLRVVSLPGGGLTTWGMGSSWTGVGGSGQG